MVRPSWERFGAELCNDAIDCLAVDGQLSERHYLSELDSLLSHFTRCVRKDTIV